MAILNGKKVVFSPIVNMGSDVVLTDQDYKVVQTIDGDTCILELTSLLNNGGGDTPSVEPITDLPAVLEYYYSGTNVEMGGETYDSLKATLIMTNMENNTKVMFNLYVEDAEMGKNSMFMCSNWKLVSQESGGYRISFEDSMYGAFEFMINPSDLSATNVYVNVAGTYQQVTPTLAITKQLDDLTGYSLVHEYASDGTTNSIQLTLDYINQNIYTSVYYGKEHIVTGTIEYNEKGQAYYVFNPSEDGVVTGITYTVVNEDYELFPQISEMTASISNGMTKVMYSKQIYLYLDNAMEVGE